MIVKHFYDEKDYEVVMKLLNRVWVSDEDVERVKTRQLFLMMVEEKKEVSR